MKFWMVLGGLWAVGAMASESQFEIDSGLVDKIYGEIKQEHRQTDNGQGMKITPLFSFNATSALTLENPYFVVDYAANISGTPEFKLRLDRTLVEGEMVRLNGEVSVGYGYAEGLYTFESKVGGARTDKVKLHVLPLTAGVQGEMRMPGFSAIRPWLGLGLGARWYYQLGNLDGFEQGYWVPLYYVRPGLTFFPSTDPDAWFGGVGLSGTFSGGFSGTFSARAVELGLHIVI